MKRKKSREDKDYALLITILVILVVALIVIIDSRIYSKFNTPIKNQSEKLQIHPPVETEPLYPTKPEPERDLYAGPKTTKRSNYGINTESVNYILTEDDLLAAEYMAKCGYGEALNCSIVERSAVYWCILNRVDKRYSGDTIIEVITAHNQFHGYNYYHPVDPEFYSLALNVLEQWKVEKLGTKDIYRTLPKEYLWFYGDGFHNYFRNMYNGNYKLWDWSIPNPYDLKVA